MDDYILIRSFSPDSLRLKFNCGSEYITKQELNEVKNIMQEHAETCLSCETVVVTYKAEIEFNRNMVALMDPNFGMHY